MFNSGIIDELLPELNDELVKMLENDEVESAPSVKKQNIFRK